MTSTICIVIQSSSSLLTTFKPSNLQWNSNMSAFTCGWYLTWILEFNIWHFNWMTNMVEHCIEIWRPCCHHLWLKLCLLLLNLWWKNSSKGKACNFMCFKVHFFPIFNLFCVFFSSFQVFVFIQIHELCVFWQGLDKLWFENWKLCF